MKFVALIIIFIVSVEADTALKFSEGQKLIQCEKFDVCNVVRLEF